MPTGRIADTETAWRTGLQEFGEQLRNRRERGLRLSQGQIASCLGLNQSTISRIESGGRPRDKAAALAIAAAYRLTRGETQVWLELLFGLPTVPMTDSAPWGESLERIYGLLERARPQIPPPILHNYFQPIAPAKLAQLGPLFDAELTAAVDWTLADKHTLPRAHLLVELAGVFIHYLNERGYYRRRLALALVAADAAQLLERRTIEGWLRSDAIPWTLLTHRPNPPEASRQLTRGLALAEELGNADMQAIGLAFLAWALARQGNMPAAERAIARALDIACTPAARLRVLWVAGDLAAAKGQLEIAIANYQLAEETDLATAHGHHTTVTAALRLSAAYARQRELGAARETLTALLADRQAPLSNPRLARIYFDLAQLSRIEGDYATARAYAQQAAAALQQADENLRFGQRIRVFLAELPRS